MKNILSKKHDWIITSIAFTLLFIGTVTIYGATFNSQSLDQGQGIISKQIILIIISIFAYIALTFFDYRWLKESKILWTVYLIIIAMLIFVRFISPAISGTHRWIMIGNFSIQPAEYAKVILILISAFILSGEQTQQGKYQIPTKTSPIQSNKLISKLSPHILSILKSLGVVSLILILILIEPAFGNTTIAFLIWIVMALIYFPDKAKLFVMAVALLVGFLLGLNTINHGISFWLIVRFAVSLGGLIFLKKVLEIRGYEVFIFFFLGILIFPVATFAWNNILKDYQKTRIETFVDPLSDPQGAGWQVRQSQIAIGSGRITGRGFMQGTQAGLKILPYAHTDFIFAAHAEQFGFVGAITILILLLSLVLRIFFIADNIFDPFAKLSTYGIGAMLLIQIIINIGMNLGKLPVTGIPLPLVSYGGSSVIVTMISLGLVQNMRKRD